MPFGRQTSRKRSLIIKKCQAKTKVPRVKRKHLIRSHPPNYTMKRPQQLLATRVHYWLAPLCLILAFQLNEQKIVQQVVAIQSSNSEQHNVAPIQEHAGIAQSGPAMMSLGSESSSALESSAALAGDDLIAAESSQSPDSAEHKTFTNAQVVRQVSNRVDNRTTTTKLE